MASIEIQGVTKIYDKQKALDNVSFSVRKGEIVGLLGPNGAGKSTLMKIITSFIPPTSGKVTVQGFDVQEESLKTRQLIGYLPENNPLYHDMYVKEYLQFVLGIYKNVKNKNEVISNIIGLTGLGPEQKKKIGALSKGYRQRVGLAQALVHDPEILILDEPTSGLDPNQLTGIRQIISDLGKHKTIILSTHIMQEVEAICNRVVIIDQGVIVADDTTKTLSQGGKQNLQFKVEFKEDLTQSQLKKIPHLHKAVKINEKEWLLQPAGNRDIRQEIFQFAVDHHYHVLSLAQTEEKMEDVFRRLTK